METKAALQALAALAQDTRLAIFRHLVERGPEGAVVGAIGAELDLAGATLSFHLKELAQAQLLESTQEGRCIRYAANLDAIRALVGYLTENCCGGEPARCGPVCVPAPAKTPRKTPPAARKSARARRAS